MSRALYSRKIEILMPILFGEQDLSPRVSLLLAQAPITVHEFSNQLATTSLYFHPPDFPVVFLDWQTTHTHLIVALLFFKISAGIILPINEG